MYRRYVLVFLFALLAAPLLRSAEQDTPLLNFGVVADIQYADKETGGARRYRESIGKLAHAVQEWNGQDLAFVIELGDISDDRGSDSEQDVTRVLETFKPLKAPLHHVLGNHALPSLGRARLMELLRLKRGYYDFAVHGWRFIVLDGMGMSVAGWPADSEPFKKAQAYLDAHRDEKRPELVKWNGAIDEEQMKWLRATLAQATQAGERVVVFCHHPTLPEATHGGAMLWNHDEVARLLEGAPVVAAYFAGHEHRGGYAIRNGVHYVTLQGLVEAPEDDTAFGSVAVYPDRLILQGAGTLTSRTLPLRDASTKPPQP